MLKGYKNLNPQLTNTSHYKMALTGGVKPDEELNFILKSLAERGKDGEIFKKYNEHFTSDFLLPRQLFTESNNSEIDHDHIMLRAYGSSAEDLQFYSPFDAGDIDLMIFPHSDSLMICEERLEYSLENPLHVRIKGSDHPVLQSCLVENTEYVATSALKNFSQAIFGSSVPFLVDCVSDISRLTSMDGFPLRVTAHLKKQTANSPAITLTMSHLLGTISKYTELLKVDSHSVFINGAAAEMECIIHFLFFFNGIDYTREHAEIVNEYLSLSVATENADKDIPFLVFVSDVWKRLQKCLTQIKEIVSRSNNKTLHNDDPKRVTPEKGDGSGSPQNAENCPRMTLTSNGDSCVTVQSQSCDTYADHRYPTVFEFTSKPSMMNSYSANNFHHFTKNSISTGKQRGAGDDLEGKIEKKEHLDCNEDIGKSNTDRQSQVKKEEFAWDNGKEKKAKGQNETNELKRRLSRWAELMQAGQRNKTLETQFLDTERVENGIDLIPAFRSHSWPNVAREWINRERKWPSPDIVSKVISEGYHLVAKSAKLNGNPDRDFRISFSHAEYLLSQEMNDIQRDCYVCMKKIHRAYLCTQPKSLVSFHLKNILLQTIEETGVEKWTDSNRAECMMVLLQNLLTALTKRNLRHFFVRSYNLFGVDYIENPQILEFLAMKVEAILENPMRFYKQLIQNRGETRGETKEERVSQKRIREDERSTSSKPATGEGNDTLGGSSSKDSWAIQQKRENEAVPLLPTKATRESCSAGSHRYHDLKDVYQVVTEELIQMACHEGNHKVAAMNPLEMSLVKDLLGLVRKYNIPAGALPGLFNILWHKRAYYWIWISTESDIRYRVLVAIQGGLELLMHHLKQDNFWGRKNGETFEVFFDRIFDPAVEIPSHLRHMLPSGNFIQSMYKVANCFKNSSVKDLREMGEKYLDLTHPDDSDIFDLFLDVWFGDRNSNRVEMVQRLFVKVLCRTKSKMVQPTKEDKDQQGDNTDPLVDLFQRLFDVFSRAVARSVQQNVAKNVDGIPLD